MQNTQLIIFLVLFAIVIIEFVVIMHMHNQLLEYRKNAVGKVTSMMEMEGRYNAEIERLNKRIVELERESIASDE